MDPDSKTPLNTLFHSACAGSDGSNLTAPTYTADAPERVARRHAPEPLSAGCPTPLWCYCYQHLHLYHHHRRRRPRRPCKSTRIPFATPHSLGDFMAAATASDTTAGAPGPSEPPRRRPRGDRRRRKTKRKRKRKKKSTKNPG